MVQELLRQFGGRLEGDRPLDDAIARAVREPVFLTNADLVDEAFDIPEGWQLKVIRDGVEPTFRLITPEGQEVGFEDVVIDPETGVWITQVQFEQQQLAISTRQLQAPFAIPELETAERQRQLLAQSLTTVFPKEPAEALFALAETDLPGLLERIREAGRTPQTEELLKRLAPLVTQEEIETFFEPTLEVSAESSRLFYEVFPKELDVVAFMDLGQDKPEELLKLIWMRGDTEAARNLIKSLWPQITDENITQLFTEARQAPPPEVRADDETRRILKQGGVEDTEIEKIVELNKLDLDKEGWLQKWKDISPSVYKDLTYGMFTRSFMAGFGDVLSAGAGLAGWIKKETWEDNIMELAETLQAGAPVVEPWEPSWATLIDPRFWATTVARALPFSISIVPLSILAATAGSAGAAVLGVGAFTSYVMTTFFGAVGAALTEASLEAGGTYNEAKAKGFSDEDASVAAGSVFRKNVFSLTGTNAIEFFVAFLPAPGRTLTKLVTKGWVRVARVAGKVTTVALTEAGEEIMQDIYQRQALGEEIVWDDEMKMAAMIGAIMGVGLGGGAAVFTKIQSRVKEEMTPEQRTKFDEDVDGLVDQGLTEEQAELRADDIFAETDEAKPIIDKVLEEVEQEELQAVIKPEDKIEELAWEHIQKQEVVPPTEFEARLQAELVKEGFVKPFPEAVPEVGPLPLTDEAIVERGKDLAPLLEERINAVRAAEGIEEQLGLLRKRLILKDVSPTFERQLRRDIANLTDDFKVLVEKESAANVRYQEAVMEWTKTWQERHQPPQPTPPAVVPEVVPEVTLPRVGTKARDIIDTYSIVSERLVGAGFDTALVDKLLADVYGIRVKPTDIQAAVAYENLRIVFTDEQLVEKVIRKTALRMLGEELGVSTHLVDVELGKIPQRIAEGMVKEAEIKANQFHNTLKQALPSVKQLRAFRKAQVPIPSAVEAVVPEVTFDQGIAELTPEQAQEMQEAGLEVTEVFPDERQVVSEDGEIIPPDQPIAKGVSDETLMTKDIGILERFRPTRQVFRRMGLYTLHRGIQRAEVEHGEARAVFDKKLKEVNKWVKKDRRAIVFRELENPGTMKGLTFNEKRAVNWFMEHFGKWADALNLPQEKRIDFYVTHIFEADLTQQLKDKHPIDPAMTRAMEYRTPKTIFNPFLQERFGKTGVLEDPFAAASAYESRQLKVFYYEPFLQKIATIANDLNTPPVFRDYLKDYSRRMTGEPSKIDKEINNTLRALADKLDGLPGGDTLANYLRRGNPVGMASYNFTSVLYTLWLGFKATSAIRNLSQHTLIIGEVGPVKFSEAIAKTLTAESRAAVAESLVMRSRKAAFMPGIDDSFASKWTDKFRETALFMFRKADQVNVRHAFLAGYYEAKAGMPNATRQELIDRGDEVAADTQYLYTKMNSMAISQSAPGRVFSVLTTWTANWMELMTKWVSRRPSQVYLAYEARTGEKVSKANWATSYKAILMYMVIVGLGYAIKEQTRLRAWEYTGITSVRYLADIIGGDFPGLEAPGAVAAVIVGFLTNDDRMLSSGWNQLRRTLTPGIVRQVDQVASGERDWLTLFFYLEGQDYQLKKLKGQWEKGWKDYPVGDTDKVRKQWRQDNPTLEAQMFIGNEFSVLSSDEARAEVLRLIEEHKINTEFIKGYEKVFGVDSSEALDKFQKQIGTEKAREEGKEIEYFTMSSFAAEVNDAVRIQGRDKVIRDGNQLAIEYLEAKDSFVQYDAIEGADGRKLFRQQFPDIEAQMYLWGKITAFQNPKSADILLEFMDKYSIAPEGVRAFVDDPAKYDELFTPEFEMTKKWFDESFAFDILETEEEKDQFKLDNPEWVKAMRRLDGAELNIPEAQLDTYVDWYTNPILEKPEGFEGTYYEDDWYLQEHPEFYQAMLDLGIWKERDFSKVPTREVYSLYQEWLETPLGTARRQFEAANPELDLWLSIKFGTKLETER